MSKFEKYLAEVKVNNKTITSKEYDKISKEVRKIVGTKSADKWDDPYEFIDKLVDALGTVGYDVDEFDVEKTKNRFRNRKSDVYIDVDNGTSTIEFKSKETDRVGYVHVNYYNDPGKKQDTRYEMSFYFQ